MTPHVAAIDYARTHRKGAVEGLKRFVSFPSISAHPNRRPDIRQCASWLVEHLTSIGMRRSRLIETGGSPIVSAEWRGAPNQPTLLIYGHYDVQPVDPLDEWQSDPFAPVVRDGYMYGRGASDDKGQLWTHVAALEAWLRSTGSMPLNVRCLFEGEEEIGSRHLMQFLKSRPREARADFAVISDMTMPSAGRPALTYALRGSLAFEITVEGPPRDLHAGMFGGVAPDPSRALATIISGLFREDGRIAIGGVYDDVRVTEPRDRRRMSMTPGTSDAEILRETGVTAAPGELGYTLYERQTSRPALTVNGITAGYQGVGSKSVIASRATAKLSMRLVSCQDPGRVQAAVKAHVMRYAPREFRVNVRFGASALPVEIDRGEPIQQAAMRALRRGFDESPSFIRSGGTVPIVNVLRNELGLPTVLMGFGLRTDNMHAPNERFLLSHLSRGTESAIWFLAEAARLKTTNFARVGGRPKVGTTCAILR